jgi:Spy/CpxP family protein refolding chaperone
MRKNTFIIATTLTLAIFSSALSAEEAVPAPITSEQDSLSLLRAELRMTRRDFVKQAMALTDEEAKQFWSIYHQYEADMMKINDRKWQAIHDYSEYYTTITEKQASELSNRVADIRQSRVKVLDKYYGKIAKALSYRIAVRFAQIEDIWIAAEDLKLGASLPLMPKQ